MIGSHLPLALSGALSALFLAVAAGQADPVQDAYQLRMDGKIDQARSVLESEVSSSPQHAAAWIELARLEFQCCVKSGNLDDAQRDIDRALELDGSNARAFYLAGAIASFNFIMKHHENRQEEYLPQMTRAITALEKALAIDPDLHEARLMLVSCYGNVPPEQGGDRAKAQQHVEELERRSPAYGAEARFELDDPEGEARLQLLRRLAAERPDDVRVHEDLAKQLAREGDAPAAGAAADRVLALDSTHNQVLLDIMVIFTFDDQFDLATRFAERYLASDPPAPRALRAYATMLLGRIQGRQGDKAASEASLAKARELDPCCWPTMRPPPALLFEAP